MAVCKREIADTKPRHVIKHKMRDRHAFAREVNSPTAQIVVDFRIVPAREITYCLPDGNLAAEKQTLHTDDLESVHVAAAMRTPRLVAKNSRISSGDER